MSFPCSKFVSDSPKPTDTLETLNVMNGGRCDVDLSVVPNGTGLTWETYQKWDSSDPVPFLWNRNLGIDPAALTSSS